MRTFFARITGFFTAMFKNPNTLQVAQSAIKIIGPLAVGIVSAVDPQDAALARQVVYEIMTDLGAVAGLLQHAQQTGDTSILGHAVGLLSGISDNLTGLLTATHVKNDKLTATIQMVVGEVQAVVGALPSAVPLAGK